MDNNRHSRRANTALQKQAIRRATRTEDAAIQIHQRASINKGKPGIFNKKKLPIDTVEIQVEETHNIE